MGFAMSFLIGFASCTAVHHDLDLRALNCLGEGFCWQHVVDQAFNACT